MALSVLNRGKQQFSISTSSHWMDLHWTLVITVHLKWAQKLHWCHVLKFITVDLIMILFSFLSYHIISLGYWFLCCFFRFRRVDDDVPGSEDGWTYGLSFQDLDAVCTYAIFIDWWKHLNDIFISLACYSFHFSFFRISFCILTYASFTLSYHIFS